LFFIFSLCYFPAASITYKKKAEENALTEKKSLDNEGK